MSMRYMYLKLIISSYWRVLGSVAVTSNSLETKITAVFMFSGTIAAATVGALGSVAAIATGGIALLGAGAAVCAFKFSPGLNKV